MGIKMKETVITLAKLFAMGVIVAAGVRLCEWVIPAPEMRVIVCTGNDFNSVDTCISAAELLKDRAGVAP
jgi:hypothetical protein